MSESKIPTASTLSVPQVSGMMINGVGLGFVQKLFSIALSLYFVRILDKEEYGAFGIASSAVLLLMTLSVERYAEYVFRVKDSEDPRYDRHFGFALIVHIALSAFIFGLGIIALGSEGYAPVAPLLFYGSLSPLLNAPRIIYSVDLRRRLDWRKIRILGLASLAFAAFGSLCFAWAGNGGLALMSQVVLTPIPYIVHMTATRRDLWKINFNLRGYSAAMRFGLYRSGASAISGLRDTAESMAITAGSGLAVLGLYGRALGLAQLTSGWLGAQLVSIVYPILSKVEYGTPVYRRASGLLLRLCLWTSAPAALAVGAVHLDAIQFIYGSRWMEAGPFVRPMLIIAVAATLNSGLNVIALTSVGAQFVFLNQVAFFVLAGLALAVALPLSLTTYAWTIAVALSLQTAFVVCRLAVANALDLRDLAHALAPIIVLTMFGIGALALGSTGFLQDQLIVTRSWVRLVIACAVSATSAALLIRVLDPKGLSEALNFAPCRIQGVARVLLRLSDQTLAANSCLTKAKALS